MGYRLSDLWNLFFYVKSFERLKILLLTLSFFFTIASYTLAKELKDTVFVSIVGREYINTAKMCTMFVLLPAILIFSYLVDKVRRHQVVYICNIFYGIAGLVSAYLIGHNTIGIQNTDTSPYRIFGWLFYFFIEGYNPFVVGLFWSFVNSVTNPKAAKNTYGVMVAGSRIGGMASAGLAFLLLYSQSHWSFLSGASDARMHQILMVIAAVCVMLVPVAISTMMKKVSGQYLHGYEAVYKLEKKKAKTETKTKKRLGLLSGLSMFVKYPYMLGVFSLTLFFEAINTVLSYQRVLVVQSVTSSSGGMSSYFFSMAFMMHFAGFFIALFGAGLMKRLGERLCLLLVPSFAAVFLLYYLINRNPTSIMLVFVLFRGSNYAFLQPLKEALYIPTVKDLKFKTKSWIDAFGSKFSKNFGTSFNILTQRLGAGCLVPASAAFFSVIIGLWAVSGFLLGKKYDSVLANNEVIGAEEEDS